MIKRLFLAVAIVALVVPACSSDDDGGGAGGTVGVTLQEFSIATDTGTLGAGDVVFEATNDGPDDVHEFVVFRTDLGAADLPTDETGAVVETGDGVELIGEIEDIAVGDSQSVTLALEAGNYVFICNIWDESEQESHYQEGMRSTFTVT